MLTSKEINLRGLRNIIRKFDGYYTSSSVWEIARGGYDLAWVLYYLGTPIIDCDCDRYIRKLFRS